jgi:hypothetical protein
MTQKQPQPWKFTRLDWIVFTGVISLGLLRLSYPFDGDQALFTLGAKTIHQGGILYRDFWDLKQPGIYAFYLLAGRLFNFNELGVHLFELIYMTVFAVVLRLALSSYYQSIAIACLTPFLTVGVYYLVSTTWHLTQVEGLVGFPLFLVLWFSIKAINFKVPKFSWLFFSGIMGGIVLLFKLLFLPILGMFWIITLFHAVRNNRTPWLKTLVQMGVPIALGLSLPLLIVLGYFAHFDLLGLLYQTFIEYPPRIVAELPKPGKERLLQGLSWWITRFAPLIVLSGIFIAHALKRPQNAITQLLVSWLGVGLVVIAIQRQGWWEYHYLLLFVPLGLLAGKGIEMLLRQSKGRLRPLRWLERIVILIVILLIVPTGFSFIKEGRTLARYHFALTSTDRLGYQSHIFSGYAEAVQETAFLQLPDSNSGNIYVFGQPLYYFVSGRGQAIPLNGWSLEFFLAEQWNELRSQLDTARPAYVFVSSVYTDMIAQHRPIADFLATYYRPISQSFAGVWYLYSSS